MPRVQYHRVNAFTSTPAGGNPAGVVFDADSLSEAQMQAVAAALAMSETAFVLAPTQPGATHRVRFFTPLAEVDLCGHATIATFFHMAATGRVRPATGAGEEVTALAQETKAGLLPVFVYWRDGQPLRVMMVQAKPQILRQVSDPGELARVAGILGCAPGDLRIDGVGPAVVSTGLPDLILPVRNRDVLWALSPDNAALTEYSRATDTISIHAFTLGVEEQGQGHTAQCRDFSPLVGIPEESATGTASGATAAYMVATGIVRADGDTVRMVLEQGYSMGKPSQISVEVDVAGGEPASVRVGGQAVAIEEGAVEIL
ncbi:MAG: PhzF family phenazine biosynthesis protein [Chloroflexota bacterium]